MELLNPHPPTRHYRSANGDRRGVQNGPGLSGPLGLFSQCLNQAKQILAEKPAAEKSLLHELVGVTLLKGHWGRQLAGDPRGYPQHLEPGRGTGLFPVGPQAAAGPRVALAVLTRRGCVSPRPFSLPLTCFPSAACFLPHLCTQQLWLPTNPHLKEADGV